MLDSAPAGHHWKLCRGRWLLGIAFSLLTQGLLTLPAAAIADPLPAISNAIKQAASLTQDQTQQIDAAVAAVAKDLQDGSNPSSQSADRQWFITSLHDVTGAPASSEFLRAFSHSMNSQLLAVVKAPDANFRAKIQAGLAAAQVAAVAQNTELIPLVTTLLTDPSPAVALEAMKSAHTLVPLALREQQLTPVETQYLDAILASVQQHATPPIGGRIVEMAYNAFLPPVLGQVTRNAAQISNVVVPLIFKLEAQRLALYQNGTPPSPQADSTGLVILLSRDVWLGGDGVTALTADQKTQALNLAAELIRLLSLQAADAIQNSKPTGEVAPLIDALSYDGKELHVFADPNSGVVPDADLDSAVSHLANLHASSAAKAITAAGDQAVEAIHKFAQK